MPLAGFLDDSERPVIGEWAVAMRSQDHLLQGFTRLGGLKSIAEAGAERGWIVGVGGIELRRRLITQLLILQKDTSISGAMTVRHPEAFVSPTATIGSGVFVGPRTVVHPQARVSDHAILNTGSVVEHDCEIGENTHIAPGAVLGGGVRIGVDCLIGLGSRVLPTIRIGGGAVVGAGAVVVRDVGPGETVVGVPAVRVG
jgi:UDP-perosamine 4-acetyltransferase